VKEGRVNRLVRNEREQEIKRAVLLAWDQNKPIGRILREMAAAGYRNRKGGPIRSAEVYRWVQEPGRVNISERTKALQAQRKERGERLGNPKIREVAPLGLAAILGNRRQRAIEVKPHIEKAIAQGAASYRQVADLLNLWGLPSAQGSRWYASSVRNAMIALDLKLPNTEQRRSRGIATAVIAPSLAKWQREALAAEARVLKGRLAKPRLGKAQKRTQQILQLSAEGYSAERIARVLDLSESSVGAILRAAGRVRMRGRRTASVEERSARILAARLRGLKASEIAREVGTTETIVYGTVQRAAQLNSGYAFGRQRLTREELEQISSWQREAIPVRVMAHRLKRGVKTIYRVIATLVPPASP
jgi:DNA invertase Pin-like site-specific DNA recombinase